MFLITKTQSAPRPRQREISFEENRGQASPAARFIARGQGYTLALTPAGNHFAFRGLSIRTRLLGADSGAKITGEDRQMGRVHYLRKTRILRDIPTYARVRYQHVYPGIDLVYYGNQRQLEYDFIVKPGADPNRIAFRFDGPETISLDAAGNLHLGPIVQQKPIVYQKIRGNRRNIDGRYRFDAGNIVRFEVGAYDHREPLIIDPILNYSTFLGSNGDDDARGVALDSSGNVYVTGSTTSTDPDGGTSDAFVTKLNPAGTAMIYATYIGGTDDDQSRGIAVDSSGNAIIAGSTASRDFPTTSSAIRRTCNTAADGSCFDAFVTKLNASGSSYVYSTYIGGTSDDQARAVAVDTSGNAVVAGNTSSENFPITVSFPIPVGVPVPPISSDRGFITKLSPSGTILYSRYIFSSAAMDIRALALDSSGNGYIAGTVVNLTSSGLNKPANTDLFISKQSLGGSVGGSSWGTFTGGPYYNDAANAIAVDASGNVYVAGNTSTLDWSRTGATANAVQPGYGGGPVFRTSDSGSTWTASGADIGRLPVTAIAVAARGPATSGPAILYAAADDDIASGSRGIYRSTDGGITWTNLSRFPGNRVTALAADPVSAGTVYAASRASNVGVVKSTNGGDTWGGPPSLTNVLVTALAIADPSTIYAGTDADGVYKSTNAGSTWTKVSNGLPASTVKTIAVAQTAPPTIYAGTATGLFRTVDGGLNWVSVNSGLFDPNVNVIIVDPANPHVVLAGTDSVGVFRSTNDGSFWVPSNNGLESGDRIVTAMTTDFSAFYAAVGQSNASRVYRSNDGINWTPTTLATARVTALAADASARGSVYASTAGGSDAFVGKWDSTGKLVAFTYLGGYRDDSANAIALDASGNVYVAGQTSSTNFAVANAIQGAFAGGSDVGSDAFVTKLNSSLSTINYSTYLGGGGNDFARAIAVDSGGNAYVVGQTNSQDFAVTPSALMPVQPGLLDAFVAKITESNSLFYSVAARGGALSTSQGAGAAISAGYARIQPVAGSTTPSGLAIFGFRQNNVLVSEAAVPASPSIISGRIYAEVNGSVNTGIAIANPNSQDVTLNFYFTDAGGTNFGATSKVLPANTQFAAFLDQTPFNGKAPLFGTMTFTASLPVSVIALRGLTNERGEFLITTLPLTDLAVSVGTDAILFPHFADGAGWTTQILLVNPTDAAMSGTIQFANLPSQQYSIPVRSAAKIATSGTAATVKTGSVRVTPSDASKTPAGVAVFSYKTAGVTVSEAGVPALRASNAFRLYAEATGTPPQMRSIETGIAIANPSSNAITVNFELTSLSGVSTGLTGSATVPANGQTAMFLNQIQGFTTLTPPFQGVLRVSTTSAAGMTVVGLRGRYNERDDFLITTMQPTIESAAPVTVEQFFPHFADGGGYTTQFILFNGNTNQSSSGSLWFFTQSGQTFSLTLR